MAIEGDGEYDFDDQDDDDRRGHGIDTIRHAEGKRVTNKPKPKGDSVFAKGVPDVGDAITKAISSGEYQRYPESDGAFGRQGQVLPKLRPKGVLPNPNDAFDFARTTPKKKGKGHSDITQLDRGQRKKAVGMPGMAPLFDFLNVYANKKGGWR